MAQARNQIDVYLEVGKTRTFAGAIEWPGWARSGRDEPSALQALFDYGRRYGRLLDKAGVGFQAPHALSALAVVERLKGNSTTDFGAPAVAPAADARPINSAELHHFQALLEVCWQAFDRAVQAARGQALRKGPRGGGRELEGIVRHVLGGDTGYLGALGWTFKPIEANELNDELRRTRQAILEALAAAAQGELPAKGPRGGNRWTPRYFVRRSAWHVLDHTWEIEDRVLSG